MDAFFPTFDGFLVRSQGRSMLQGLVKCYACIKVPQKSQFSDFCGSRSTNLSYKSLTCHEGFFYLKNKISFAEETIGNIWGKT